jgi:hypothetical protein
MPKRTDRGTIELLDHRVHECGMCLGAGGGGRHAGGGGEDPGGGAHVHVRAAAALRGGAGGGRAGAGAALGRAPRAGPRALAAALHAAQDAGLEGTLQYPQSTEYPSINISTIQ